MGIALSWFQFVGDFYVLGFCVPQTFMTACFVGLAIIEGILSFMQLPWIFKDSHENRETLAKSNYLYYCFMLFFTIWLIGTQVWLWIKGIEEVDLNPLNQGLQPGEEKSDINMSIGNMIWFMIAWTVVRYYIYDYSQTYYTKNMTNKIF